MATINFSVPDEVKREFQEKATDDRKRQQTRAAAIEALLKLRQQQLPVSDEDIQRARQTGRP